MIDNLIEEDYNEKKVKYSMSCNGNIVSRVWRKESLTNNDRDSKITAKKVLAAYFTFLETDGVDAPSSASRVILDNEVIGSTKYMARMIQENISAVQEYPGVRDLLVD